MPEPERPSPEISLAAPAYNEAEGIEAVVREWCEVLRGAGLAFEIVICNDGSSDGTGEILEQLRRDVPELQSVGGASNRGYGSVVTLRRSIPTGNSILATLPPCTVYWSRRKPME